FVLSLLANAVFIGVFLFKNTPSDSSQKPSAQTESSKPASKSNSAASKVIRLDWHSVESPDYKDYIKNLRAIGCPEETIFDIIVADVNTLYAMKARSLPPTADRKSWEPASGVPSREELRNQKLRRELENEKRALLADILG